MLPVDIALLGKRRIRCLRGSASSFHPLDWAFACLSENLNNFHARNMALKLEGRKNTTVGEGILVFFTNLEIWRLIMLILLENMSTEISIKIINMIDLNTNLRKLIYSDFSY